MIMKAVISYFECHLHIKKVQELGRTLENMALLGVWSMTYTTHYVEV